MLFFAAGADDVLRKPVHVREIVARVGAINRRVFGENGHVRIGELASSTSTAASRRRTESPFPCRAGSAKSSNFCCAVAAGE